MVSTDASDPGVLLWRTGSTVFFYRQGTWRDLGVMVCKGQAQQWCRDHRVAFIDLDSRSWPGKYRM